YLKAKNIKAIEKQKNANILVVENRYEKMGESLYRINNDATNIILWLDGNHTFDEIAKKMCDNNTSLIEEAKINLNEFLNSLILNYGIVIDRLENPRYDEIRVLGNGKTQYPSAISIEITHTCNVKCLHCYGEYSCYNKFKDNTESIFKVLEDARRSGTRVVEFTGGEVTCHPRFLDILDKAYSLNYHLVSILSNGTNWNEDLFNEIYKNRDKTVVQIDLHGDNDDYINWFMGSKIKNISNIIKSNIVRIHKMGIYMRIV
ncbi:TPA: radical SAM protein, partial [Streptococcus pyogenes]|nr:radical SAM protein [Streptococcus pyogenes]